jgi:hypothetical protein
MAKSSFGLLRSAVVGSMAAAALGCSDGDSTSVRGAAGALQGETAQTDPEISPQPAAPQRYVLGSVSIDPEGSRVSYAQLVDSLSGHFSNSNGIETQGNAVFLSRGNDFYYGLAQSPEWVRYSLVDGGLRETGRLSFLNFGISSMDFANTIVDADTAVSVLTQQYVAVVWNPTTMEVTGTIDLGFLRKDGLELETFTTISHDGLVYVPAKWVNWDAPTILQLVNMTVLDPKALSVVWVAEDDRCGAGGRVTFDAEGYAYVMGDGRNQSMQVFAEANGQPTVPNCLLRIAPGGTDFEADYYYEIPSLTGGLDSMTELEAAGVASGIGFSMMAYPDRLPPNLDRVNFEHWDQPAYKMWRIELGDPPVAAEVQGANFSVVGFSGSGIERKLYSPESVDGVESTVYEIDPDGNTARAKFTMAGYFAGLYPIGVGSDRAAPGAD